MVRKLRVVKVKASELVVLGAEQKGFGEIAEQFLATKPPLRKGQEPTIYDLIEALEGLGLVITAKAKHTTPRGE